MVDATLFLPGLSLVQGKAVIARFDGGRLSSEGGLLVLREVERRLGLADRLAACLKDRRAPEKVVHRLAEIIRFRMLMIAAGTSAPLARCPSSPRHSSLGTGPNPPVVSGATATLLSIRSTSP